MEGCSLGSMLQTNRGKTPNWQNIPAFRWSLFTSSCFLKHWKSPKMKSSGRTNVLGSWPLGCNLVGHDPSISQSFNQSIIQSINPSINQSINQSRVNSDISPSWIVVGHSGTIPMVIQLDVELRGKKAPLLIWLGKFSTCWARNPHRKSHDEYLLRKK